MKGEKKARRKWKWTEGLVDSEEEHIKISYGDDSVPVGLVAPPEKRAFTVQFVLTAAPSTTGPYQKILEETRRELDFYLVENREEDLWAYAKYHCSTAANLYSPVHWGYYPKGYKDWLSEKFDQKYKNMQKAKKEIMKVCPKCNKGREKALQVTETEVTWWGEEGYYVAKPNGKHRIYEKCLICGTELQKDDSQILGQTSESFENFVIEWIEVAKMKELLGHGVQFLYPGGNGNRIVIAFIDGFEWHPKVKVFILSAESELWDSYTDNPKKILRTLKECVYLVLKGRGGYDCQIIKDNIFCVFNA